MGESFEWSDKYSICKLVDEQHKKLFSILKDLEIALKQGAAQQKIIDILAGLKQYTIYHFRTEELMFEIYGFPQEFRSHKLEHDYFVKKIGEFAFKYFYSPQSLDQEVLNFLQSWIKTHILGTDKDYAHICQQLTDDEVADILRRVNQE